MFWLIFCVVDAKLTTERYKQTDTTKLFSICPVKRLVLYMLLYMSVYCLYSNVMLLYMSLYMCVSLMSLEGLRIDHELYGDNELVSVSFKFSGSVLCSVWKCVCLLGGGNFLVRDMDVCHTGHMYSRHRFQVSSNTTHRIKCPKFWCPPLICGIFGRFYLASLMIARESTIYFEVTSKANLDSIGRFR